MYKIVKKEELAPSIYSIIIEAPLIAKSSLPGQFVVLIVDEEGERVPLTICDSNEEEGTIELVTQSVGVTTMKLNSMDEGEYIPHLLGPLGRPSPFVDNEEEYKGKKLLLAGGGVGTAPLFPSAEYLSEKGVEFDVVIGAKNKDFVILEDKFKSVCDNVYVTTDDGSYGNEGFVNTQIEKLVKDEGKEYDQCFIAGPMIMMKFTSQTTKELNLPTVASMNPIMVDGTGMCGACRITVGGETKFACVDGPEFDAHEIDFDEALSRSAQYKGEEAEALHKYEQCELGEAMSK